MKPSTLRFWYAIHRWSSLLCSPNLLLLCLTGLVLIFHHELDELLGIDTHMAAPASGEKLPLESLIPKAEALSAKPGWQVKYFFFDDEDPVKVGAVLLEPGVKSVENPHVVMVNAYTGEGVAMKKFDSTLTGFIFVLHKELFLGIWGQLYIGFIGILFAVSTISGVILYAPFTKRLAFGVLRWGKGTRIASIDLHNFFGIATVAWTLLVGLTGCVLAVEPLVLGYWQNTELREIVSRHADTPAEKRVSVDTVVEVARKIEPDRDPALIFLPGTVFSGERQFTVVTRERQGFGKHLFNTVLVNAETGELTDQRAMPWYVQALVVSGPLHFGDYGGMPLKIAWTLFALVTIAILVTGIILWLRRGGMPIVPPDDAAPSTGGTP